MLAVGLIQIKSARSSAAHTTTAHRHKRAASRLRRATVGSVATVQNFLRFRQPPMTSHWISEIEHPRPTCTHHDALVRRIHNSKSRLIVASVGWHGPLPLGNSMTRDHATKIPRARQLLCGHRLAGARRHMSKCTRKEHAQESQQSQCICQPCSKRSPHD